MASIEDLLNSFKNDSGTKYSPKEVWQMIANGDSLEDMGFSTDDELKEWKEQNPYADL